MEEAIEEDQASKITNHVHINYFLPLQKEEETPENIAPIHNPDTNFNPKYDNQIKRGPKVNKVVSLGRLKLK